MTQDELVGQCEGNSSFIDNCVIVDVTYADSFKLMLKIGGALDQLLL